MSDDELNQKIESKVDAMMTRLEDRLCKDDKVSVPPKQNINGWKAAGVIVSVIIAIATPALTLTWFVSDQVSQVKDVQKDVDRLSGEISGVKTQVSRENETTRKEIQRLREAFAAYTHVMLPMMANGHFESDAEPLIRVPDTDPLRTPVPGSLLLQVP
jgi:hypothetical protein